MKPAVQQTFVINGDIKSKEVRVLGSHGEALGVMHTNDAINLATSQDADLILINEKGVPPVCKIQALDKHKYELSTLEKERKRKARENVVDVKEIQLRPVTDKNDIAIKAKKAKQHLIDGDKVRVVIKFKGREFSHVDLAEGVISKFCDAIGPEVFVIDTPKQISGKQVSMVLKHAKEAQPA